MTIDWSKPIETVPCERNPKPVPCEVSLDAGDDFYTIRILGRWIDSDDLNEEGNEWRVDRKGRFFSLNGRVRNVAEDGAESASSEAPEPAAIDWSKPIETVPCERNPEPVPCHIRHHDWDGRHLIYINGPWIDGDDRDEGNDTWYVEPDGEFVTLRGRVRNVAQPEHSEEPPVAVGDTEKIDPLESHNYAPLRAILDAAYEQSAAGKGVERHGNGLPWLEQPILTVTRHHGLGFATGQAEKKIREAVGMVNRGDKAAAERELLGAIVYVAGAIQWIKEQE